MHVAYVLLADAANLSQEGKLNVLGVFDGVQAGSLPAVHPRATLVVRLKAQPSDAGEHRLTLTWRGPSGTALWSSTAQLAVAPFPPGVLEVDIPFIATVDLPLEQVGRHALQIMLDDEPVAQLGMQVSLVGVPQTAIRVPAGTLLS